MPKAAQPEKTVKERSERSALFPELNCAEGNHGKTTVCGKAGMET